MSKVNWNKLKDGLKKYQSIMEFYEQSERISTSDEFKKLYRNFYGMNRGTIKDLEFKLGAHKLIAKRYESVEHCILAVIAW
jgi:hypothetical protein